MNWQETRCRFNHDWLKNQYLQSLARYIRILEGRNKDTQYIQRFVVEFLPQWEQQQTTLDNIFEFAESEMTPANLFDRPPLDLVDSEDRDWMQRATHLAWLKDLDIENKLASARTSWKDANEKYERLRVAIDAENEADVSSSSELLFVAKAFYQSCRDVGNAISELPSRVIV